MPLKQDTKVTESARQILTSWTTISPKLPKEFDGKSLALEIKQADEAIESVDRAQAELVRLENAKQARLAALSEKIKRIRSLVKGVYGDDSTEYELVGGTRRSERKRPVRKAKGKKEEGKGDVKVA